MPPPPTRRAERPAHGTSCSSAASLPGLPGVYRYFDAQGQVLYVGKARNLKKRVSSYFHKDHGGTRIGHMVSRIAAPGNHGGAHRGRGAAAREQPDQDAWNAASFNILFRDDKSYPYLKLSGQAAGPAPSGTSADQPVPLRGGSAGGLLPRQRSTASTAISGPIRAPGR